VGTPPKPKVAIDRIEVANAPVAARLARSDNVLANPRDDPIRRSALAGAW
jgi:hypothetical protein